MTSIFEIEFDLFSDEWVGCGRCDAAHVVLVPGDLDVALVAPALGPGVLDQPVLLAALLHAVADAQDAVVERLGVAAFILVHACWGRNIRCISRAD